MEEIVEQMFMMPVLQEIAATQGQTNQLLKPRLIIIRPDLQEAIISQIDLVLELMINQKGVLQDLPFLTIVQEAEALLAVTKVTADLQEVAQVQADHLLQEAVHQEVAAAAVEVLLQNHLVVQEGQDNFETDLLKK